MKLSICADTSFLDLPFETRMRRIAEAGFYTEFWGAAGRDMDAIAADDDIRVASCAGFVSGSIVHPDGVDEFMDGVRKQLTVADTIKTPNLGLCTGSLSAEDGRSTHAVAEHPATMWITAYKTLCQIAELAEKHNVQYNLEALNIKTDHGGYPVPLLEDAVRLLEQVDSPRIRLLFDVYHAQIQEGNVIQCLRDYADFIGYVHFADVPGRNEPGTGEINYPNVVNALREIGYDGYLGLEAYPSTDDKTALAAFAALFD